ncbi:hypothetical protein GOODEAATRI_030232 [Goodea atripinnis]|uniref:Uncharacterized protein n=1 Tax=Goodea atripinnis TaxID=208336 RepID=A0ABV0P8Y5_9TELE
MQASTELRRKASEQAERRKRSQLFGDEAHLWGCARVLFCTWPPFRMRMGVVGDWHEHGLARTRFSCKGGLPVSAPAGNGTTSWVQGLVVPMGYRHLDLGV